MSLKRKYVDSEVNGRTVSEPSRPITGESATKSLKRAKRETKDWSLSSTSNPEIFSPKSKSENTACSPESSTAESSSTGADAEPDLDSDSKSSTSDDKSDDESSSDLDETSSEESSQNPESPSEEDIGQSDASSNISIETDDDPEKIVTLRPGKKPKMRPPSIQKSNSLLKRLQAFLPKLQNANQVLEQDRIEGRLEQRRMENVEKGEERVTGMSLGLEVLESMHGNHEMSSGEDEVVEAEGEIDILGRLMGHEPKSFSIDELE